MRCPECTSEDSKVLETRLSKNKSMIRRRRECTQCNYRYTTQEEILRTELSVVKSDGRREELNLQKIRSGIMLSCRKRSVSDDQIDFAIEKIKQELERSFERDVPAEEIGRLVMEQLKSLDPVAYIRFASVYQNFSNPEEFIAEIQSLRERP